MELGFFTAIILGIVEGMTEFLPVSSTGHMIITAELLGIVQTPVLTSFEIAIQLGAIMAVVVLYARRIMTQRGLFLRICVGFLPTALIGVSVYSHVKTLLTSPFVVVWALGIGGIVLIAFERWYAPSASDRVVETISYREAMLLGLWQTIALIPGVSRSGATIIGGMLMGLPRTMVVEFTFLLAIPTMIAATGMEITQNPDLFTGQTLSIFITGFLTAFLVALLAVRWLIDYIAQHTFTAFGVYRIVVALLVGIVLLG